MLLLRSLNNLQVLGAAVLLAGVVAVLVYAKGHGDGRAYEQAKQAQATVDQLEERNQINDTVRTLDDCDLLRELGVSRLPEHCS